MNFFSSLAGRGGTDRQPQISAEVSHSLRHLGQRAQQPLADCLGFGIPTQDLRARAAPPRIHRGPNLGWGRGSPGLGRSQRAHAGRRSVAKADGSSSAGR